MQFSSRGCEGFRFARTSLDKCSSFQSRKMPHPRPLPTGNISHHRAKRRAVETNATMRLDSNAAAK
jgi:hypothetical protein